MKGRSSLKQWLTVMLAALWLVFLAAFWLLGNYAEQTMRRNAVQFNENMLQLYMEKLDGSIDGISRFLSRYAASESAISVLARSTDETERYFAVHDIMQQLNNGAFLYDNFSGFFIFSRGITEDKFLYRMNDEAELEQLERIRELVTRSQDIFSTDGWKLVKTGEESILIQGVSTGSTSCGAWIDVEDLALPMEKIELGESGKVFFLDSQGRVISKNGEGQRLSGTESGTREILDREPYLAIRKASTRLPITLLVLIAEKEFARDSRLGNVVAFVCVFVLFCFPFLWSTLRRRISRPVERLTEAMQMVEKGNLAVQVEMDGVFREFAFIGERFNQMVRRLHKLSQDVYEQRLQVQKTQLQYLQLQIRPHFFLNALNSLYAYALTGRCDLVEKLTLCLSRYFRYMLRSSAAFVTLGEELEHISNYMEIQQMRKPGQLVYLQEVEQNLLDAQVLPLLVQTFMENCIKYGERGDRPLEICLFAEPILQDAAGLRIVISDNGKGYPAAVLEQTDEEYQEEGRTHGIGIENARRRLKLSYGDRAKLYIGNQPEGGARVEILLPLEIKETRGDGADEDPAGR